MKDEDIRAKAEAEKIKAKLQEALARLDEMDATARQQKAQAVTDAIVKLRARRDEIQTRLRELKDANAASIALTRAEIEERLADFEEEVSKVAARLKSQTATAK